MAEEVLILQNDDESCLWDLVEFFPKNLSYFLIS